MNELAGLSLGDKRLDKRAKRVLSQLSSNSADSIPVACGGAAETKAAYRFFDNGNVEAEKIHATHFEATLDRMKSEPVVLIPQDTSVLNFTSQHQRHDAGPTTKEATKGMHLHCAIAVTPEKVCLGALSIKQWHRETLQKLTQQERKKKNHSTPIEEKESYRWLENLKKANEYAKVLPTTTVVSVADREGDIYEIYKEANAALSGADERAHYLIRAKTDRKTCDSKGVKDGERIRSTLRRGSLLGKMVIDISETNTRKQRSAHVSVYSQAVYIALPDKQKKDKDYKPIKVTSILCSETNPPKGVEPIDWLLITDLTVLNFEDACEKIEWYSCRWQIEIFFKILKSGCKIEKLQLTDNNFKACLGFYIIISWRILHAVMMGRYCPGVPCEVLFSKEEWQTAYVVIHRKKPPKTVPTLNEMIRMVASLGGYQNYKSSPEPGVKTLWIGVRNMQEHLKAKDAFESAYGVTCG